MVVEEFRSNEIEIPKVSILIIVSGNIKIQVEKT
jgi:hypothetical protein